MTTASSHTRTSRTSSATIKYIPGPSTAEQIAEAIGCIISGRPLPEYLRPQALMVARPTTVEEGIARILAKPGLC